jgi:thioredoxin reductase (NADPH)
MKDGAEIGARCILLATGLVDEQPDIEGLNGYSGAVRFCPICDGYEAMDKRVGVLGSLEAAAKKALFLRTYTRSVLLFAIDRAPPTADDTLSALKAAGVTLAGKPVRIEHSVDRVVISVAGGGRVPVDVLYPALGCTVRSELAAGLGAACNDVGNLKVDDNQQTSIAGLYGAGDVVTDLHQLSVATAHAAIAATAIHNRLDRNPR